ncbi:MAG: 50S ribosomal protein L29 [bacterium]|nr:50S ribosomal protein L29 [bacterium]
MKRNDITALPTKSSSELQAQLQELQVELSKLRLEKPTGRLSNPRRISVVKDDIARIKTVLHQQRLLKVAA